MKVKVELYYEEKDGQNIVHKVEHGSFSTNKQINLDDVTKVNIHSMYGVGGSFFKIILNDIKEENENLKKENERLQGLVKYYEELDHLL